MKKTATRIATLGLLSVMVATTYVGVAAAETPPQDDRMERREFQAAQAELKKIKERRQELMHKYNEQKEAYLEKKESFLEARKRYRAAQANLTDEQKAEFTDRVYAYLTKTVETLVQRLERIQSWVEGNKKFTDEQKEEIVADIDAQIAAVQAGLADLEGASLEEMQEFGKSLRARLASYKQTVKDIVAKAKAYHLRSVWDKANKLVERLEAKVTEFEGLGIDVTKAEELLENAKTALADGDDRAAIVEAYKNLRQLVVHLKQAVKQDAETE